MSISDQSMGRSNRLRSHWMSCIEHQLQPTNELQQPVNEEQLNERQQQVNELQQLVKWMNERASTANEWAAAATATASQSAKEWASTSANEWATTAASDWAAAFRERSATIREWLVLNEAWAVSEWVVAGQGTFSCSELQMALELYLFFVFIWLTK